MNFLIIIIALLILSLISSKGKGKITAKSKGIVGENQVKRVLKNLPSEYTIINDVLIKYKSITTQIDHIVVCSKGVFVIETKNYSGIIFGDDSSKYWTQKLNGRSNTFYSPLWQNRTHVNAIRTLLKKYKHISVYSIVVFCGNSNIKRVKCKDGVISIKELSKYIKTYKAEKYLEKEDIKNVSNIINFNNIQGRKARSAYIKTIKKEHI
ncbi:MAG: NERD domain-containing protein [Clostridium sp.]|uniref:nuclease-related domain-containing protein n=1 Tax=Clostridium sp. DSM 8431 TaxID=1761781 RepID=UPI0008E662CF|nr:nuclease-related domain-containing protein [Clostridium sp. DSM 8431]MCR4944720.1 NERD domain-containing protein [Clostridium sp.]SFU51455.1 Nuclease-related domain-containing protein [Clostridium sp. DSM 8431]